MSDLSKIEATTWIDTVSAAKSRAKSNGNGYAFAVQWPAGHFTVEDRKPSLRAPGMRVLDCDTEGHEVLA